MLVADTAKLITDLVNTEAGKSFSDSYAYKYGYLVSTMSMMLTDEQVEMLRARLAAAQEENQWVEDIWG